MKAFAGIFLFIVMLYALGGCSKGENAVQSMTQPEGCDSMIFSYKTDIHPIIAANCSGATCHNGVNNNYDFSTYAVLADRISHGRVEYLLRLPQSDPQHMPQNGTMSACNLYREIGRASCRERV